MPWYREMAEREREIEATAVVSWLVGRACKYVLAGE